MHHSLTACAQTNCSRNAIPRSRYRSDIGPYLHVVIASLQPCSYAPDDYSCHSALRFPDVPPRCRTIHCLPIAVLLQGHAVIILARDHLFVHERGDGVGVNGRSTTTQHNTTQHNTTQHNTTQHNTTQHNTTQHNTTQHNTTQHNTTQHNTTQHSTQKKSRTTQHNNATRRRSTQHHHEGCGWPLYLWRSHSQCMMYVVALRTNLMDGWPPPERRPSID